MRYRHLAAGDEAMVEAFLVQHADTAMFLRSNLRAVGFAWNKQFREGQWVARIDDRGAVAGVVCHAWHDMILIEDVQPEQTVREVVAWSQRRVAGFIGPAAMVAAGRAALGMTDTPTSLDDDEVLMTLPIEELKLPRALETGSVVCRRALPWDTDFLVEWRHDYNVEALHMQPGDATRALAREQIERGIANDTMWVAVIGETIVSTTAFNATLPDIVQIGGVYTPPDLRGRGYAQCAVAGSLAFARELGVKRAVLFADKHHPTSTLAYRAIGFVDSADYALVMFAA